MLPKPYYAMQHYPLAADYKANPSFENLIDSLAKWDQYSKNDEKNIIQAINIMQFIQNQYGNESKDSIELAYKYMDEIIATIVHNHKDYNIDTLTSWLGTQGVRTTDSLYDKLCNMWVSSIEDRRVVMNHDIIGMRFDLERIVVEFKEPIMKGNSESFIFYACRLLDTYSISVPNKAALMAEEIVWDLKSLFVAPKVEDMHNITRNLYRCIIHYLFDDLSKQDIHNTLAMLRSSKYLKANADLISDTLLDENESPITLMKLPPEIAKEKLIDEHIHRLLFIGLPLWVVYKQDSKGSAIEWLIALYNAHFKFDQTKFYNLLLDFIEAYSVKINIYDPDDKLGKMVTDVKKVINQLNLQRGIDFALEAAKDEPLIDPMYDRRELGFNEQEMAVMEEAAKLIDAIDGLDKYDQKSISDNILTNLTPKVVKEHADIVDFAVDFSIKYPHYIKPSLIKARLESLIADAPYSVGTVLNESIYKLSKFISDDAYIPDNYEYAPTYNLEAMRESFDDAVYNLNSFTRDLEIINDIAQTAINEDAASSISWENIAGKLNGVRSDVVEAVKSNGPAVTALIKKAEDIADEKEKNAFIRTKILPPLKRIIVIAASTGLGMMISPAAALVACVVAFSLTKNVSKSARQSIANELEADLAIVHKELQTAYDSSDTEKERNLRILKKKLQVEYYKLQQENEQASSDNKILMSNNIANSTTNNNSRPSYDDDY